MHLLRIFFLNLCLFINVCDGQCLLSFCYLKNICVHNLHFLKKDLHLPSSILGGNYQILSVLQREEGNEEKKGSEITNPSRWQRSNSPNVTLSSSLSASTNERIQENFFESLIFRLRYIGPSVGINFGVSGNC